MRPAKSHKVSGPLQQAIALAEPEGQVRIFIDKGMPLSQPLSEEPAKGVMPGLTGSLLGPLISMTDKKMGVLIHKPDQKDLNYLALGKVVITV